MQKLSSLEKESQYIIIHNNTFLSDRLKEVAQEHLETHIESIVESLGNAVDDYSFRCCDCGRGSNFLINSDHSLFCKALKDNMHHFQYLHAYVDELDKAILHCRTKDEISKIYFDYGPFLDKQIVRHMEHLMELLELAFKEGNYRFRDYVDMFAERTFDNIYIHNGHILEAHELGSVSLP